MTKEELIRKLSDLEWEDFEVKAAKGGLPKNTWETVSAFSNTSGGWLLFGIGQSGIHFEIQGITDPEKVEQDFLNAIRGGKFNVFVSTRQEKYILDGKTVIAFYVPASKEKPVYYNSLQNTFIRRGSSDQRASREEIDAMYRDQTFGTKTSEIAPGTSRKDINNASLSRYRDYMSRFNPTVSYNRYNEDDFLQKLRIMEGKQCTLGGLLFLGNRDAIERFFPDFRIDLLEIPGTSYTDAKVRYTFRMDEYDNLWEYYFECVARLKSKVDVEFQMGNEGFAMDVSPGFDALREALVNMLMHSDHFSPACPRIRIFTDHIEFYNPGGMPKPIEELKGKDISLPRNPVITKLFRVVKLAENAGYGLDNIEYNWNLYNHTVPQFNVDFDSVIVNFRLIQAEKPASAKKEEFSESQKDVGKMSEKIRNEFGTISERMKMPPDKNINDLRNIYGVFKEYLQNNFGETWERVRREFGETLEEHQRRKAEKTFFVLLLIAIDNSVSAEDMAGILGISIITVKRYLKKLTEAGIVGREGSDKSGFWQIN